MTTGEAIASEPTAPTPGGVTQSTIRAGTVLDEMRNHLALSTPLAFLFGAGASASIRVGDEKKDPLIPTTSIMTDRCRALFDNRESHLSAWAALVAECKTRGEQPHIESILSRIRSKLDAAGEADKLVGLSRSELQSMEKEVCSEIVRLASPDLGQIAGSPPHERFADWLRTSPRQSPVEIFTTNYDLLLETYLERAGLPIIDAFVGCVEPFFLADVAESDDYIPSGHSVCLWKLHGSINWAMSKQNTGRIIRVAGTGAEGVILPSQKKYDESRKQPYITLLDRLSRFLRLPDALLVTIGYSFGDEHINSAILGGIQRSPRAHVWSLQFEESPASHPLPKLSRQHAHLACFGPRSCYRGCRQYEWAGLKDAPASSGFLLGDFAQFSDFLAGIDATPRVAQ